MNDVECAAIEQACAKLAIQYCHLVDQYDHDALPKLWAKDGVWETMKGPARNHAEIRAYLDGKDQSSQGRHHATNILVNVIDNDHAEGVCYYTFYAGPKPAKGETAPAKAPMVMGRYFDKFVRTPDGWRFAHRRMEMEFKG